MLCEGVASEGTAVSESRSRAGVWQGGGREVPVHLDEIEDVQSHDANSPAIARSQFSVAVSCDGIHPAASGHRALSAGGESVESVDDPEGENSSMPTKAPSRSILSIARREVSPAPQAPGSPEHLHHANSLISKPHVQELSVRCGTPASVYAQGVVLPTPRTQASSLQTTGPQSSSGSEAGPSGKQKRKAWLAERLEGQASVPLNFGRLHAEAQALAEGQARQRAYRNAGDQSVNAMWRGDSHDGPEARASIAGPIAQGWNSDWRGFANGHLHPLTGQAADSPAGPLADFARTAVSCATQGRAARPAAMMTPQNIPNLRFPVLLPSHSIRGQYPAYFTNGRNHHANSQQDYEGHSPRTALNDRESQLPPIKQEQADWREQMFWPKSRSSSKIAQQVMRECLSNDTTASHGNTDAGPARFTDSHIPEPDNPTENPVFAQELHRRDSVIAKIEDDHMQRGEPDYDSMLQRPLAQQPQASSWQGSALDDGQVPGDLAADLTLGSLNHNVSGMGQAGRENRPAESLSNAWPAQATVVGGAAHEPGLVAQSPPSKPGTQEAGPKPALATFENEGLLGPKIEKDDGAEYPVAENEADRLPANSEERQQQDDSRLTPGPARSRYTGKRRRSSDGPTLSHASNM